MCPRIIKGGSYKDQRGEIIFNNSFDALGVKRLYIIQNNPSAPERGWQGHKIEQRWFTCIQGTFEVVLKKVLDWEGNGVFDKEERYALSIEKMDVLHVPPGYVSKLIAKTDGAKILAMSDYLIGEVEDEFRFSLDV